MTTPLPISRAAAVRHEAAHAAALLAQGIDGINSVDVIPTESRGGFITHDHKVVDHRSAAEHGRYVMAAWLAEGCDIPRWPLDSGAVTSVDEKRLAQVADVFGWERADYENLIVSTKQLMASPAFRTAYTAITDALATRSRLDRPALQRLLAPKAEPEYKTFSTSWRAGTPTEPPSPGETATERALQRVDQLEAEAQRDIAENLLSEFSYLLTD